MVEGRPGLGTFVVASSSQLASEDREKLISGLRDWVDRARLIGLDAEGIAALVAAVMASEEPIVRE